MVSSPFSLFSLDDVPKSEIPLRKTALKTPNQHWPFLTPPIPFFLSYPSYAVPFLLCVPLLSVFLCSLYTLAPSVVRPFSLTPFLIPRMHGNKVFAL